MSDEPEDFQEVYDEECRTFLEEDEAAFTSFQKVTKAAEKEYYGRKAVALEVLDAASVVYFAKKESEGKP